MVPTDANLWVLANEAPVAQDDSYTVDEDAVLSVDALGVLANDTLTDDDGGTTEQQFTVSAVTDLASNFMTHRGGWLYAVSYTHLTLPTTPYV